MTWPANTAGLPGQAGAAGPAARCAVLPAGVVAAYANAILSSAQAWSVEAHLPGCPACRAVLRSYTDAARLDRNRVAVLARAALPPPGLAEIILRRCGVPEHVAALLAATPSLRRSWLAGVLLVLGVAVGAAQLAFAVGIGRQGTYLSGGGQWVALMPFLFVAPLLPLAAVAAAFSPRLDPAFRLASAAPVSKVWLLLVRSAAVVGATLLPTAVAALLLPGDHQWLAAALLLPALAVCAAALALATVTGPAVAAIVVAAGWLVLVAGLAMSSGGPASVLSPASQVVAVVLLAGAGVLIVLRRNKIDYGWVR
jgi:hypothetical protein